MIISHKWKFIFIKTHKTAGSSIEEGLIPHCGPDDVITPMESNYGTSGPRNYYGDAFLDRLYAQSKWPRKLIDRHSPLLKTWYYEHMPAWRVREQIGDEVWNSYFKFCFERNPWDKVVSYFFWKRQGQGRRIPEFTDYVLNKTHRLPADGRLYFENGRPMVDFAGRFERLADDITAVCEHLGIPFAGELPREKVGIATSRRPFEEYFGPETNRVVAELFADEIRTFGYGDTAATATPERSPWLTARPD